MKKQKYLYILFLIILQFKLISNPNIDVDFKASNQYISPYLFGGFIEYYFCFSNGNNGIWAQEFNNRGFDYYLQGYSAIGWDRWQSTTFNNVLWESLEGGYNENGQYYEKMSKSSDTGSIGLGQFIYTTDDTGYDFYIYAKSEKPNLKLKLKVLDYRKQNILFDTILGNTTLNWEKYSSKIPNFKNQKKVFILIYFDQTGSVCIDEASIMP
jgi:hypothetical protein